MKKPLLLFCGLIWLACGLLVGLFLLDYLGAGAGFWDYGYLFLILAPGFYSGSVMLGFVHVIGLFMLFVVLCGVGLGLCMLAFEPPESVTAHKRAEAWRARREKWN